MSTTLYWLQGGGCGGDSISLLSAELPDIAELFDLLDIEVLWHPSFSNNNADTHQELVKAILAGEQPLDILCLEGSVMLGPDDTGMFDTIHDRPKKDLLAGLANQAQYVVAVGTCAAFGGFGTGTETQATGAQFLQKEKGGFLGEGFVTDSGLPVINLPGCPCHPDVVVSALTALVTGESVPLSEYNAPLEWYGMLIHQGCTRNEYHEYRVEETDFGQKGCMFFHMGCHGPMTYGPCNKVLWNNRRNSKTRVGVPCFGCTQPDFPQPYPFFQTQNIEGIPLILPDGVNRAHYMAYKGMAAAATPERLKERKTRL